MIKKSPLSDVDKLMIYISHSNELYFTGALYNLREDHVKRSRAARIMYFSRIAHVPLE